jgi:hypothetical protein
MTTRKIDAGDLIDIHRLLDVAVTVLEHLLAVYAEGTLPARAQPGNAAKITRRGRSLLKAIVETQAAYELAERRAAGKSPAEP